MSAVRGNRGAVALTLAASVVLTFCLACSSDKGGSADVQLSAVGRKGKAVAAEHGCVACHTTDGGSSTGPTWKDLAGSTVKADGKEVQADDAYLTRSIVDPHDQIVDGYADIMPTYEGKLSKAEITQLVAYLRDLSPRTYPTGEDP